MLRCRDFRENWRFCLLAWFLSCFCFDIMKFERTHVFALLAWFQRELMFLLCWRGLRENTRLCFVGVVSEMTTFLFVGVVCALLAWFQRELTLLFSWHGFRDISRLYLLAWFQRELTFLLCWRDFRENWRFCFVGVISERTDVFALLAWFQREPAVRKGRETNRCAQARVSHDNFVHLYSSFGHMYEYS